MVIGVCYSGRSSISNWVLVSLLYVLKKAHGEINPPTFQSIAAWSEIKRYTHILFLLKNFLVCYLHCINHNCSIPAGQILSFHWLAIMWRLMPNTAYLRTLPLEEPVSHWYILDSFLKIAQFSMGLLYKSLWAPNNHMTQYLITHKGILHSCRSFA